MIIGSGLVAKAMAADFDPRQDCLVFASGVSNSQCIDCAEYAREKNLLDQALTLHQDVKSFLYFSTCSIYDPDRMNTPYVQHKLSMEKHVARHGGHLILRLPQLAGRSDNPHTLLNYLYLSIKQNKALSIWTKARRNIIDSMDMARIVRALVDDGWRNKTVNIANAHDYSLMEIVRIFETILGRPATVDFLERGSAYNIDVSAIEPYVKAEGIRFDKGYLERVLSKYYENN